MSSPSSPSYYPSLPASLIHLHSLSILPRLSSCSPSLLKFSRMGALLWSPTIADALVWSIEVSGTWQRLFKRLWILFLHIFFIWRRYESKEIRTRVSRNTNDTIDFPSPSSGFSKRTEAGGGRW